MGDGDKGNHKYGIDSTGMGNDVQGGDSEGANLWKQELGIDRGNSEGAGGFPPLGGPDYIRDVSLVSWGRVVRVVIVGKGLGGNGAVTYEGLHLEVRGYHCGGSRESTNL